MRIAVIGGTGKIGTYLIPQLVNAGHEVSTVSRGYRKPYFAHPSWKQVKKVYLNRHSEERNGRFGQKIKELGAQVVIDLICFHPRSAAMLTKALTGHVEHFIHCGTILVYGNCNGLPLTEAAIRRPIGSYDRAKANIETFLLNCHHSRGFPVTVLHPGALVGKGWIPINPAGNHNTGVFKALQNGKPVHIPDDGTVSLHQVHSADLAQAFIKTIEKRQDTIGQVLNITADYPVTFRQYATEFAAYYEREAELVFTPANELTQHFTDKEIRSSELHMTYSSNCPNDKARGLLNFIPSYSGTEAAKEAVEYFFGHKKEIRFNKLKYRLYNKLDRFIHPDPFYM